MFSRIAIVNRGEAAMRLIHAVRDLNAQAGPDGGRIATVALHTEGERRAMFVGLWPPMFWHVGQRRMVTFFMAGLRLGRAQSRGSLP